jgi:hypothetical protein
MGLKHSRYPIDVPRISSHNIWYIGGQVEFSFSEVSPGTPLTLLTNEPTSNVEVIRAFAPTVCVTPTHQLASGLR